MTARLAFERGQALCAGGQVENGLLLIARSLELGPVKPTAYETIIRSNISAWSGRIHHLTAIWPGDN